MDLQKAFPCSFPLEDEEVWMDETEIEEVREMQSEIFLSTLAPYKYF